MADNIGKSTHGEVIKSGIPINNDAISTVRTENRFFGLIFDCGTAAGEIDRSRIGGWTGASAAFALGGDDAGVGREGVRVGAVEGFSPAMLSSKDEPSQVSAAVPAASPPAATNGPRCR